MTTIKRVIGMNTIPNSPVAVNFGPAIQGISSMNNSLGSAYNTLLNTLKNNENTEINSYNAKINLASKLGFADYTNQIYENRRKEKLHDDMLLAQFKNNLKKSSNGISLLGSDDVYNNPNPNMPNNTNNNVPILPMDPNHKGDVLINVDPKHNTIIRALTTEFNLRPGKNYNNNDTSSLFESINGNVKTRLGVLSNNKQFLNNSNIVFDKQTNRFIDITKNPNISNTINNNKGRYIAGGANAQNYITHLKEMYSEFSKYKDLYNNNKLQPVSILNPNNFAYNYHVITNINKPGIDTNAYLKQYFSKTFGNLLINGKLNKYTINTYAKSIPDQKARNTFLNLAKSYEGIAEVTSTLKGLPGVIEVDSNNGVFAINLSKLNTNPYVKSKLLQNLVTLTGNKQKYQKLVNKIKEHNSDLPEDEINALIFTDIVENSRKNSPYFNISGSDLKFVLNQKSYKQLLSNVDRYINSKTISSNKLFKF